MGVPKFFRWLSERYPKILSRHGCVPTSELLDEYDKQEAHERYTKVFCDPPDPMSTFGLAPEIDNLYVDVNGILHGCSHNNIINDDESEVAEASAIADDTDSSETDAAASGLTSHEEIARNVCFYLDRLVKEVAKPQQLLYLAIDGVAPRAKLNQQRARRYQSGSEHLLQQTIYQAHVAKLQQERNETLKKDSHTEDEFHVGADEDNDADKVLYGSQATLDPTTTQVSSSSSSTIQEAEDGRFFGKLVARTTAPEAPTFLTTASDDESGEEESGEESDGDDDSGDSGSKRKKKKKRKSFHPNSITPGTQFFADVQESLLEFIRIKLETDEDWKNLTVIFSGSNVPGEGEHKLMDFIRQQQQQQQRKDRNPPTRDCIVGQDGDLIMLGLVTHDPNLLLLRERVLFDKRGRTADQKQRQLMEQGGSKTDSYIMNPHFEVLHFGILREYLALEFAIWQEEESSHGSSTGTKTDYDLERTIDDFVFLTFLIGNDFLPHMPALDIRDEAFELLFFAYREERSKWLEAEQKSGKKKKNWEPYLTHAGSIVSGSRLESFLQVVGSHEAGYYDYKKSTHDPEADRKAERRYGPVTTPSDSVLASKEAEDRLRYRRMIRESYGNNSPNELHDGFEPVMTSQSPAFAADNEPDGSDDDASLSSNIGNSPQSAVAVDDQDMKGRYYYDKFGFTPFDVDKHTNLRKAYIEGLVWNLKYYYEGCPSWEWYYPYHYGPMMSDLVDVGSILEDVSFDGRMGAPLLPFEQLLACLPHTMAHSLPVPYRQLMTAEDSPIVDFYPRSFTVDMNGKRWPWEAAVLLPFIDSERLKEAAASIETDLLSPEELARNEAGETVVLACDNSPDDSGRVVVIPFDSSSWHVAKPQSPPLFRPELPANTQVPIPGRPTFRNGPLVSMWRKRLRLDIHGVKSRYKTACLELDNSLPENALIDRLASEFIGTIIHIDYPHLNQAFVTAVSDSRGVIRGKKAPRLWQGGEVEDRKTRLTKVVSQYVFGESLIGTGGLALARGMSTMEDQEILLHVRPMSGLKEAPNGVMAKTFAKTEIEVPLFVTSWSPYREDPRLSRLPALLEKNPYKERNVEETSKKPKQPKKSIQNHHSERVTPSFSLAGQQTARGFATLAGPQYGSRRMLPTGMIGLKGSIQPGFTSSSHLDMSTQLLVRTRPGGTRPQPLFRPAGGKARLIAIGVFAAATFFSSAVGAATFEASVSFARQFALERSEHAGLDGGMLRVSSYSNLESSSKVVSPLEFAHGTTTLAFAFKDGIIVAVDSRASLGNFVGSKTTQKVLPVHSHMLATMAGGAADCSFWIRKLRAEASFHELKEGRRMSVARASRLLSNALYENRALGLAMGTMIAGFDAGESSAPKIYYIDNTGLRIEGDLFAVGSGSTFALGILDTERRMDMTVEQAVALGIKAIRHATFRDAYSGGFINVYVISRRDGWNRVFTEDVVRLV